MKNALYSILTQFIYLSVVSGFILKLFGGFVTPENIPSLFIMIIAIIAIVGLKKNIELFKGSLVRVSGHWSIAILSSLLAVALIVATFLFVRRYTGYSLANVSPELTYQKVFYGIAFGAGIVVVYTIGVAGVFESSGYDHTTKNVLSVIWMGLMHMSIIIYDPSLAVGALILFSVVGLVFVLINQIVHSLMVTTIISSAAFVFIYLV